jgi:long-chain acyl-CoA synthetase
LDAASEHSPGGGRAVHPQGISPRFIQEVLAAWREEKVVCPLDTGQAPLVFTHLPGHCAHLKTTSATTGTARAIVFAAEQMAADAANIVSTMGLRPDWPNVGAISLAHSYGFSNLVLPLLLHGIPLILAESPLPEAIRRATAFATDITMPAVPALWRAWHDSGAIPGNLRLAISAGAPLPLALEQSVFDSTGVKIHNFYGASECGGIAFDSKASPRADATCVGVPLLNVKLAVAPDGCLLVRGPAVGETYWPEPHDNLKGGRYRTSDLAELRDGAVYLRGRAGDVINVAGRKVSPELIEQRLGTHPRVRDCLVFGAPFGPAERTEMIVAVVAGSKTLTADDLRQFLLDQLPAWQVPREWVIVDSLRVNQRGKLSRTEWRRRFLEERGQRQFS